MVTLLIRRVLCLTPVAAGLVLVPGSLSPSWAQNPDAPPSLKTVPPPKNATTDKYVRNRQAAIQLGKALFWDMQVGSDGQACASCHFHAGADNRIKNQLNPGSQSTGNTSFDLAGPNYTVHTADFPFHKLLDPDDRHSDVVHDYRDVTSSQGVFKVSFTDIILGSMIERGTVVSDTVFNVGGINTRRVEPRNTPTMINAIYNYRNFWDGRANNIFNGVNPFGLSDSSARVFVMKNGRLQLTYINPDISSLASQADGPPLSQLEMSYIGRIFQKVGKKMLSLKPLGVQHADPTDSVLGSLAVTTGSQLGLRTTYSDMIRTAFRAEYWGNTTNIIKIVNGVPKVYAKPARALRTDEYTEMEYNLSLFLGLAIQMYTATLISDDSRFDRFQEGEADALTADEQAGLDLFLHEGRCINCHNGPLFSNATIPHLFRDPYNLTGPQRIERMVMGDLGVAVYDSGFYNIGVRPTEEDIGVGGIDPFGRPLSLSRRATLLADPVRFDIDPPAQPGERVAVDGAFKAPILRNVELTGPYFHNGGQETLEQVVQFYDRGGDFADENIDNLDPDIQELGLTDGEKAQVVAFLKALTDERVRIQSAPFDHPQLFIPNGHPGDETHVTNRGNGLATDAFVEIPATGRAGGPALQPFEAAP